MDFLFGYFLKYFFPVATGIVFFLVCAHYIKRNESTSFHIPSYTTLFKIFSIVVCINALLLTLGQYHLWQENTFTHAFLNTSLKSIPVPFFKTFSWAFDRPLGYFIFYAIGHFWLTALLSFLFSYITFLIFRSLEKHKERFFEEGEVILGTLIALLVGWPLVVPFYILTFLSIIIVALIRLMVIKKQYTTFGIPFIVAGAFTFLLGEKIITILNLGVLRV